MNPTIDRNTMETKISRHAGQALKSLISDQAGVTAIEYALLAALIAVVIAGTVAVLGVQVQTMWATVSTAVSKAI